MADEIVSTNSVASAPVAPVADAVVAAPAPIAAPSAPVVTETAAPSTPAVEIPAATPPESTLLSGDKAKPVAAEVKPVDGETKPADAPEASAEVVVPVFEAFTLPEGISFEAEKLSEFTNTLAEFETKTKASHEEVQQFGQSLIDRHIKGVQEAQDMLLQKLIDDGKKERESWKESFLTSPEFANRTDTVLNSAIDAIGIYGGSAEQQTEFRELMASTGVGNHPAMIRMLSNIMLAKPEPKQLAAPTIAKAVPKSQMQKRYGAK